MLGQLIIAMVSKLTVCQNKTPLVMININIYLWQKTFLFNRMANEFLSRTDELRR